MMLNNKKLCPTIKTSNIASGLERYYLLLNNEFFQNKLPSAVIIFSNKNTALENVWSTIKTSQYELVVPKSYLSVSIEDLLSYLLHQMVHLYCHINKIKETSRGGSYHNKKFRDIALSHGLIVKHSKKHGWSITEPSNSLLQFIEKNELNSLYAVGGITVKKEIHKNIHNCKYSCPKCGQSVRATKIVNIICGDCNTKLIRNSV